MILLEDITLLGFKEVSDLVQTLSPHEVKAIMPQVSQEQMLAVANATNEQHDADWRAKTLAMMEGIKEKHRIETVGSVLTPAQLLEIMDHLPVQSPDEHWKISALFVGLSADQFSQLLVQASPSQMGMLCHESLNEPMQHQLRVLCKEWMKGIDVLCNAAMDLEKQIADMDLSGFTHKRLLELLDQISAIQNALEELKRWESKALRLTWNTNTVDLIEKFGMLKDLTQRSLQLIIGPTHSEKSGMQGLYGFLQQKLTSVFQDLGNEDPGFEALSRFSIWYIEDYWKLGLIPSVKNEKDLDSSHYSEEEYEKLRSAWTEEAKKSLEKYGLTNVAAFKENAIFSASMLKDFLDTKQGS